MSVRRLSWYWLGPALLGIALYALTIRGTFIYDDVWSCHIDPRLNHPALWPQFFYQGYMPGAADNLWRPLVSMSYAIQAWGNGDRPWAFHLVNILLHGLACLLVAKLGARLANKSVGLVAGLLFAAHPVHVEAVAGIVGRAEEMALIGVIAGLLLFIGQTLTTRRIWGIVGCFLFAVFSKEQGLLLPLFLLVWYWLSRWPSTRVVAAAPSEISQSVTAPSQGALMYEQQLPRELHPSQRQRRMLVGLFTAILAIYVTYRNHILPWYWESAFLDPAINPLVKSVGVDRWLIPIAILGRYSMLLIAPYRLSIDYGMSVFTTKLQWNEPWFYLGLLTLFLGVIIFISLWRRRRRPAVFCLIAFAGSYGLVSNVSLIGTIMGDRLMYLPSAFFCILFAMFLPRLNTRRGKIILVALLILGSIRTVTYAWEWNDKLRLYHYAVDTQPKASMPYLLLADELNYHDADIVLAKAREIAPDAPQVWTRSAWCKLQLGQLKAADQFAHRAFKLRPGDSKALNVMSLIYEAQGAQLSHPTTSPR